MNNEQLNLLLEIKKTLTNKHNDNSPDGSVISKEELLRLINLTNTILTTPNNSSASGYNASNYEIYRTYTSTSSVPWSNYTYPHRSITSTYGVN